MGGFIVGILMAGVILLIIAIGKSFAKKRKKTQDVSVIELSNNKKFEEKEKE